MSPDYRKLAQDLIQDAKERHQQWNCKCGDWSPEVLEQANQPAEPCPDGCCTSVAEPEDDYERDFELPEETPAGAVSRVPDHYQGNGLSPFDVIDAYDLDFYEGNALKYLLRWRRKGGKEDLRKAIHYLEEIIERHTRDGADD